MTASKPARGSTCSKTVVVHGEGPRACGIKPSTVEGGKTWCYLHSPARSARAAEVVKRLLELESAMELKRADVKRARIAVLASCRRAGDQLPAAVKEALQALELRKLELVELCERHRIVEAKL